MHTSQKKTQICYEATTTLPHCPEIPIYSVLCDALLGQTTSACLSGKILKYHWGQASCLRSVCNDIVSLHRTSVMLSAYYLPISASLCGLLRLLSSDRAMRLFLFLFIRFLLRDSTHEGISSCQQLLHEFGLPQSFRIVRWCDSSSTPTTLPTS